MTDADGSDAIWKPPGQRDGGTGGTGRALPPPHPPWAGPPPTAVAVTEAPRRRRRWLLVAGGAAAAAVAGAVIAYVLVRGPEQRTTEVATIEAHTVTFEPVELAAGVGVERTWRVEGRVLHSVTSVRNRTAVTRWVVYDEVVPPSFAGRVRASTIEGPGKEELTGSIARFVRQLEPEGALRVTYDVPLAETPDLDELQAWTEDLDRAYRAHLADPELSPVDGDADGVPDRRDRCASDPGSLKGCPDGDDDGVADPDDDCASEPGTLRGCPDADADGVADAEDRCPSETGSVDGCPDADDDRIADRDDECPRDAGELAGCPDADGDGFGDGDDDACAEEPGPVEGCPDGDDDGWADGNDQCPTIPGPHIGCPDDSAVRWAVFDALDAHVGRLSQLGPIFDPDGNRVVEDGPAYCAEVRSSFEGLRRDLDAAVAGPPAGASAETVTLVRTASENVATNLELLESCLDADLPFPWEDADGAWVNECTLVDALVERVTGRPYECNSTW